MDAIRSRAREKDVVLERIGSGVGVRPQFGMKPG
jgi:hypothetical protein